LRAFVFLPERELALFKKFDEERKARRTAGGVEEIEEALPRPAGEGAPE
jgi:hypothetical protein